MTYSYSPSEFAIQYHSIIILPTYESYNSKNNYSSTEFLNTWDTWMMIPTEDPLIVPSQILTSYTDFESWDGALDETEVLTDSYYRQMTSGTWEFSLDFYRTDLFSTIYELYTHLLESIHGQQKMIIFTTDLRYMYKVRLYVDSFEDPADGNHVTVTIGYNAIPEIYYASNKAVSEYLTSGTLTTIQKA